MKQIYLMLSPTVQEKMAQYAVPILRHVCKALNIEGPLFFDLSSEPRFVSVKKLTSKTWREYLETAMDVIDNSERVVRVDVGAWQPHSVADDILEQYCKLIYVRVDGVLIDVADWAAITEMRKHHFIYSQLPDDTDIYNDKSENWKE